MRFRSTTGIYFSLFCSLSILSVSLACQKKKETSLFNEQTSVTETNSFFNKNVGGPIDSATANRWKRNLASNLARKAPAANSTRTFYLPGKALRSLIANNKVAGVCFYFGTDASGSVHVVPVAVDNKGYVITAASVATSNGSIDWEVAKKWRLDFKEQNPGNIWGHFWGSVAINRLLENNTETVRVELGLSDEGTQQMMFSSASVEEPVEYGDRTRSCPPFCPSDLL